MRLIDADALKKDFEERQKLSESGEEYTDCFRNDAQELSTEWWCVEDAVDSAPTIDAVPVVRCRECNHHRDQLDDRFVICRRWRKIMEVDGFCHKGAKMDEPSP